MSRQKLEPGSELGRYEVRDTVGAGAMGDVYKAHDSQLGRDVAVKVLPMIFAGSPERLKRFEQEARAVSRLNHPNIVTVYDVGAEEGLHYVVMELLKGESLREVLGRGPVPPRKAIDYGIQVARGLSAAHNKKIVHRDLKPENIFVTRDGHVKILDFGLARQNDPELDEEASESPTMTRLTEPGMIMGTVGYMAPEQVRGQVADHRSDIFAFGAVLHEMVSGERTFYRETGAETMSAILNEEPSDFPESATKLPVVLDRVVGHCLEKDPEHRFQAAHDIVFDLENYSEISIPPATRPASSGGRMRRWLLGASIMAAVLAAGAAMMFAFGSDVDEAQSTAAFRRLTFRRGIIQNARFTADGGTVVYSATWGGGPLKLYLVRTERPGSQALELPSANLLAMSPSGEIAIGLGARPFGWFTGGTLAQAPLLGGRPREILENAIHADIAPDGSMAVWRSSASGGHLEYPIGSELFTGGVIALALRLSPSGDQVAVHMMGADLAGEVIVFDREGDARTLATGLISAPGLAWSPSGDEIWYAATPQGEESGTPAIYAVDMEGENRLVARTPGWLWLHDISADGQALLTHNRWQSGIVLPAFGDVPEVDLAWLDWSVLADLSADGQSVLFTEAREGVGNVATVYMRRIDGSPAVRLGEGVALGLSRDGRWALALQSAGSDSRLAVLPTGAGETTVLESDVSPLWGGWLPDGRIVVSGNQEGEGARMFLVDPQEDEAPRPITPVGTWSGVVGGEGGGSGIQYIMPGGRAVLVVNHEDGSNWLYPIDEGEPRPVTGMLPGEVPAGWSEDERLVYVYRRQEAPIRIFEVDLESGTRRFHLEVSPTDLSGVHQIASVLWAPDRQSFMYTYTRTLSDLYLAADLK